MRNEREQKERKERGVGRGGGKMSCGKQMVGGSMGRRECIKNNSEYKSTEKGSAIYEFVSVYVSKS